jgi:hypothetical protein
MCLPSRCLEAGYITPLFRCCVHVLLRNCCFCGSTVLTWDKYATIHIYRTEKTRYKIVMKVNYVKHETYMDKESNPLRVCTILMFGIATRPWAERPTSWGSNPNSCSNFSLLYNIQIGTGSHGVSYTMGPGKWYSPGVKRQGRETDHSPSFSAEVKMIAF